VTRLAPPPAAAAPAQPGSASVLRTGSRRVRAVWRLTARLVSPGAAVVAAALAGFAILEIRIFRATYPDEASRAALALFDRTPAVRMLQGPARGIDTAGGFTAWDGGWVLAALVAIWAMLAATRLLRGEEDDERVALLLAAPLRARALALVHLGTVGAGCVLFVPAVAVPMIALGAGRSGSLLFGLSIGGFAAVWAAAAGLAAQLFDSRRRALIAVTAGFALAYGARLVANSIDDRAWLRRFTPWGWLDEVEPFAARRLWPVAALWLTAAGLGAAAVALRGRRDTGGAFLALSDRREPRVRWLRGPGTFAWHETRGVLLGWAVGLAAWAAVLGVLLTTMLDLLTADEAYRRTLDSMGLSGALTPEGFVGAFAGMFGVGFSLYACWRIAAARAEEGSGRLDLLLVRQVTRRRWLGGQVGVVLGGLILLALVCGTATWAAAAATSADLSLGASLRGTLNQVPVAVLFTGLATLVLAVLPRLTLALPAAAAGVGYMLERLGPGLTWPEWVIGLSPFHHLAQVPAEAFAATPALVLTGIGLLATFAGLELFQRRDLVTT
jgi:ABC-2 type transport system permease protein